MSNSPGIERPDATIYQETESDLEVSYDSTDASPQHIRLVFYTDNGFASYFTGVGHSEGCETWTILPEEVPPGTTTAHVEMRNATSGEVLANDTFTITAVGAAVTASDQTIAPDGELLVDHYTVCDGCNNSHWTGDGSDLYFSVWQSGVKLGEYNLTGLEATDVAIPVDALATPPTTGFVEVRLESPARNSYLTPTEFYVTVTDPPTASFTHSPTSPSTGDTVTFDASGSSDPDGSIVSYEWDLDGDGTTDLMGETVSHAFASEGDHEVTLTVTDDDGSTATERKTITVSDTNRAPTASFTYAPGSPEPAEIITFDASGSSDPDGSIRSYSWDFGGDGVTDATGETTDVGLSAGTHPVTLTVTDDEGATDSKTVEVTVEENQAPTASFTHSPTSPSPGETVTFDASGSSDPDGSIESYEWDLDGDDTTDATGETVSHAFASDGDYLVTLTVTDDDGSTAIEWKTITVGFPNQAPSASFAWDPDSPNPGEDITFDASGSIDVDGSIASYEWDLDGDGTVDDTGQTTTATFGAGTHPVTLTVTDDDGATDSVTYEVTVEENQAPTASFTWSPSSPTAGDFVTFDASRSFDPDGSIASYEWDFGGDGRVYDTGQTTTATLGPGTHVVTLTVTDDDGATDSVTAEVKVSEFENQEPWARFTWSPWSPTAGDSVTFDASRSFDPDGSIASYEWDLDGDGTTDTTGETVSRTFENAGDHEVTLTVTDDEGATDSLTVEVNVSEEENQAPTASFTHSPSSPTAGDTITFDGSGSADPDGSIASYEWDFDGDSTVDATGQTATVALGIGSHPVTLTVTDDDGATDSVTGEVTVSEEENQPPTASFTWSPNPNASSTVGTNVTFDASGSSDPDGSIVSYTWEFPIAFSNETMIRNGRTTTVTLGSESTTPVTLTVTDDDGATDSTTVEVDVSEGPPDGGEDGDRDGDGIPDESDGCADEPEDFDGVEDEDGCPDETIWTQDHLTEEERENECVQNAITLAQQIALSEEAADAWQEVNKPGLDIEDELAPGEGPEINFTDLNDSYGVYRGDSEGIEDQIFVDDELFENCSDGNRTFLRLVVTILHETAHWKDDVKKHDGEDGDTGDDAGDTEDEEGVQLEEDIFGEEYPADGDAEDIDRWVDPETWTDDDANASANGLTLSSRVGSASHAAGDGASLELTVEPTVETVDPGDPVRVDVTMTNTGNASIEVLSSVAVEGYPFRFDIRDADGDRVAFLGPEIRPVIEDDDFVSLAPGESHTETVNLGLDPVRGTPRYVNVTTPGEYTVTAVYGSRFDVPSTTSNSTTVTVNSTGDDDALSGIAATYDDDGDDRIDIGELGVASADYAQGAISIEELGEVAAAFART